MIKLSLRITLECSEKQEPFLTHKGVMLPLLKRHIDRALIAACADAEIMAETLEKKGIPVKKAEGE